MSVKGAESYTRPIVSLSHKQQMLVVDMYVSSLHLHVEGHVFSFTLLEEYVLPNAEIVHPCFLSFCTLSELYVYLVCIRHSLGSSRKSVHERHQNSDGWQVK